MGYFLGSSYAIKTSNNNVEKYRARKKDTRSWVTPIILGVGVKFLLSNMDIAGFSARIKHTVRSIFSREKFQLSETSLF